MGPNTRDSSQELQDDIAEMYSRGEEDDKDEDEEDEEDKDAEEDD